MLEGDTQRRENMYMAIAVEPSKNVGQKSNYKIWYLQFNDHHEVVNIGVKSRSELVKSILENYNRSGKTNWRAFKRTAKESTAIEVFDFISMGSFENTHFGDLPTLEEFQDTINALQMKMEISAIAS